MLIQNEFKRNNLLFLSRIVLQKNKLNENSIVEFHRLITRREKGKYFVIGREDINTYIAIPKIGVEVIELLNRSLSIKKTT